MTGSPSAPSLKDSVSEVVNHQEFKEQLASIEAEVEITDEALKKKIEAVKALVGKIDVASVSDEDKKELAGILRGAIGNDPDDKKFQLVIKQLGLAKLGLMLITPQEAPPSASAQEKPSEKTSTVVATAPITLTYEKALAEVPVAQKENIKKLLDLNRGGEADSIDKVIAGVLARVGRDLEGIRSAQEAMKKATSQKAGSVEYQEYFAILGLTPKVVAGAENIEALKKVAGEKARELLQGIKPEVLSGLTKPLGKENPEEVQKRIDLANGVPEWAVGDDLETQYKGWVNKGGQESFGKWVSEIREIPEDEKGLWGMFNRPWFKQIVHQLGKFLSKIGGLWEQVTTGKKPDPEKNRPKSEWVREEENNLKVLKEKKETLDNIRDIKAIVKADKENIKIKGFTEQEADKLTLEESRQLKEILKEKGSGTVQGLALEKGYSIDTLLLIDSKAKEGVLSLDKESQKLSLKISDKEATILEWDDLKLEYKLQNAIDWKALEHTESSDEGFDWFGVTGKDLLEIDLSEDEEDLKLDDLLKEFALGKELKKGKARLRELIISSPSVIAFLKSINEPGVAGEVGNNDGLHFGNSGELPLSLLELIAEKNIDITLSKNLELGISNLWNWTGDLMATVGEKKKDFDTFEELEKWLRSEFQK